MIRSDELAELNAALSAAQGEFEAVAKTASNPFFKSKYAALPEVVEAATPILAKNGLSVWQAGDVDEAGELLWTVVLHKSGQFIGSSARLLPIKNDPQAQGSAVTYQRRYQYMAALGLVADVDDDGQAAVAAGNRTRQKPAQASSRGGKKGGAVATAPESVKSDKADDAAPPEGLAKASLTNLRTQFNRSGWSNDKLIFTLIGDCGVADVNESNIGKVMEGLSLDQAVILIELMGGKAEDLV